MSWSEQTIVVEEHTKKEEKHLGSVSKERLAASGLPYRRFQSHEHA